MVKQLAPVMAAYRQARRVVADNSLGCPRDREAIQQSQSEKYPAEYGPQIEQYLRESGGASREEAMKFFFIALLFACRCARRRMRRRWRWMNKRRR